MCTCVCVCGVYVHVQAQAHVHVHAHVHVRARACACACACARARACAHVPWEHRDERRPVDRLRGAAEPRRGRERGQACEDERDEGRDHQHREEYRHVGDRVDAEHVDCGEPCARVHAHVRAHVAYVHAHARTCTCWVPDRCIHACLCACMLYASAASGASRGERPAGEAGLKLRVRDARAKHRER
jgi:hypothetical protein